MSFFTYNVNQAIGRGRGEKIEPLPFKEKIWLVIVHPPYELSTRLVYERYRRLGQLTRISHAVRMTSGFFRPLERGVPTRMLVNDLSRASSDMLPEIKQVERLMRDAGAKKVLMSGSGPTMFSIHGSRKEAKRVGERIRRRSPALRVFICHTF